MSRIFGLPAAAEIVGRQHERRDQTTRNEINRFIIDSSKNDVSELRFVWRNRCAGPRIIGSEASRKALLLFMYRHTENTLQRIPTMRCAPPAFFVLGLIPLFWIASSAGQPPEEQLKKVLQPIELE